MTFSDPHPDSEWNQRKAAEIHIRIRPTNVWGGLFTVLLHVLLILWILFAPHKTTKKIEPKEESMVWVQAAVKKNSPASAVKTVKPKTPVVKIPPSPHAISRPKQTPPVIPSEKPEPQKTQPDPEPDLSALLAAKRQQRQAAEDAAKAENEAAQQGNHKPSAQEIATANVQRSLRQREGTNGLFTITSMSTRTATLSFRGWTTNALNSTRQSYEVDAGLGGNVELAVVRKVIEVIRLHYSGDFSWESQRLGHTVTLSARPADTAGLEEFLLKEFFSTHS